MGRAHLASEKRRGAQTVKVPALFFYPSAPKHPPTTPSAELARPPPRISGRANSSQQPTLWPSSQRTRIVSYSNQVVHSMHPSRSRRRLAHRVGAAARRAEHESGAVHAARACRWLDAHLADAMRAVIGFRNVLVHGYTSVDLDIMRNLIREHPTDLDAFGAEIRKRLSSPPE